MCGTWGAQKKFDEKVLDLIEVQYCPLEEAFVGYVEEGNIRPSAESCLFNEGRVCPSGKSKSNFQNRKSEIESRKSEIGNRKAKIGGQLINSLTKSEIESRKSEIENRNFFLSRRTRRFLFPEGKKEMARFFVSKYDSSKISLATR